MGRQLLLIPCSHFLHENANHHFRCSWRTRRTWQRSMKTAHAPSARRPSLLRRHCHWRLVQYGTHQIPASPHTAAAVAVSAALTPGSTPPLGRSRLAMISSTSTTSLSTGRALPTLSLWMRLRCTRMTGLYTARSLPSSRRVSMSRASSSPSMRLLPSRAIRLRSPLIPYGSRQCHPSSGGRREEIWPDTSTSCELLSALAAQSQPWGRPLALQLSRQKPSEQYGCR